MTTHLNFLANGLVFGGKVNMGIYSEPNNESAFELFRSKA